MVNKKEQRLSPIAKRLLEGARQRMTHPREAIKYLQSVPPEKLNLYDKQKIGREILARSGEDSAENEDIKKNYNLSITRGVQSWDDVFRELSAGGKCYKNRNFSCSYKDYQSATFSAEKLGFLNLAIQGYKGMIKSAIAGDLQVSDDKINNYEHRIVELREKKNQSKTNRNRFSGLEKTTATAVIGLLGGLFFLSSNITGNAIGTLNQTSSNWIGAVFLIVGLVAGFFWVKSSKK